MSALVTDVQWKYMYMHVYVWTTHYIYTGSMIKFIQHTFLYGTGVTNYMYM